MMGHSLLKSPNTWTGLEHYDRVPVVPTEVLYMLATDSPTWWAVALLESLGRRI